MIIISAMANQGKKGSLSLIEYIRALEGKDSVTRGMQVQSTLESLGIESVVQKCRVPRINNIIVDFSLSSNEKRLVFSAHYDVVKGCPGANDNASGVAVLLGLCRELKQQQIPVRVIFFDREEAWIRTPVLRLGLLGSLYYVFKHDLHDVSAVYNLEFCGLGESLAVWPVKSYEKNLTAFKAVEIASSKLKLRVKATHIPWLLLSSDHLSFRLKRMSNAVTLSLVPNAQVPALENLVSSLSVLKLLSGQKPILPEILSSIHTASDTSSQLNEDSLRLMLSLLLEIIRTYDYPQGD
jgi:hypothetical protein